MHRDQEFGLVKRKYNALLTALLERKGHSNYSLPKPVWIGLIDEAFKNAAEDYPAMLRQGFAHTELWPYNPWAAHRYQLMHGAVLPAHLLAMPEAADAMRACAAANGVRSAAVAAAAAAAAAVIAAAAAAVSEGAESRAWSMRGEPLPPAECLVAEEHEELEASLMTVARLLGSARGRASLDKMEVAKEGATAVLNAAMLDTLTTIPREMRQVDKLLAAAAARGPRKLSETSIWSRVNYTGRRGRSRRRTRLLKRRQRRQLGLLRKNCKPRN